MQSSSTRRRRTHPWTRLYHLAAWHRCLAIVRARDGGRCTEVVDGRRCTSTRRLHGHHTRKVKQLWLESPTWADFVRAATDPRIVRLVCATHNNRADAAMRKGGWVAADGGLADPREVAADARPRSTNRFSTAVGRA